MKRGWCAITIAVVVLLAVDVAMAQRAAKVRPRGPTVQRAAPAKPTFLDRIKQAIGFGMKRTPVVQGVTFVPELAFSAELPRSIFNVEEIALPETRSWQDEHLRGMRWDVVGTLARPFAVALRRPGGDADARALAEYGSAKRAVGGEHFVAIPPYDARAKEVLLRLIAAEAGGCPVTIELKEEGALDAEGMAGAAKLDALRREEAKRAAFLIGDAVVAGRTLIDAGRLFFIENVLVHGERCRSRDATMNAFRARVEAARDEEGWTRETFLRIPANNMEINAATEGGVLRGGFAANGVLSRSVRDDRRLVSPQVHAFFPEKDAVENFMRQFFRFYFLQKMWCEGDMRFLYGALDDEGWCTQTDPIVPGEMGIAGTNCPEVQVICDDLGNPGMPCVPKEIPAACIGVPGSEGRAPVMPWIACPKYVHFGRRCLVPSAIASFQNRS